MSSSSSSNINTFLDSTNEEKPVLKKLIRISGNMLVAPIPDSLFKNLPINEETWWVEEIPTSEGIFLRIASREMRSCHDAIEDKTLRLTDGGSETS